MRQKPLPEDLVIMRLVPLLHPTIADVVGPVRKIHGLAQVPAWRLLVVLAWLPFRHAKTSKQGLVKLKGVASPEEESIELLKRTADMTKLDDPASGISESQEKVPRP